jgi:hypothetical protein
MFFSINKVNLTKNNSGYFARVVYYFLPNQYSSINVSVMRINHTMLIIGRKDATSEMKIQYLGAPNTFLVTQRETKKSTVENPNTHIRIVMIVSPFVGNLDSAGHRNLEHTLHLYQQIRN